MRMTRRQFLHASGLAAAYAALPGLLAGCGSAVVAVPPSPEIWAGDGAPDDVLLHLVERTSYGSTAETRARARALGADAFLDEQLHPERIDDTDLDGRLVSLTTLLLPSSELIARYPQGQKPGPQPIISELEQASLLRATYSQRQLQEVMVDFWSNHFNIFIGKNQVKWLKTADDRDVIRPNALGKFRDLLLASARSPAMLVYLDNAQSSAQARGGRGGLNENYARELMELHTLGADAGYDHDDIVAVARILSGWSVARQGDANPGAYMFRPRLHDDGPKQVKVLGLSLPGGEGEREGEKLLAALAAHPDTARRIARKLCARFVSDDPPPALVERAAQAFLTNDGDIRATLALILRSDEFKASTGQKIKLPTHALASMLRATGAETAANGPLMNTLRQLGQPFFGWHSPDGYPQAGAAWVNTGGLLARWNAAFALAESRLGDARMNAQITGNNDAGSAAVDAVCAALLGAPAPPEARATLTDYVSKAQGRTALPGLVGLVLASPAFQIY